MKPVVRSESIAGDCTGGPGGHFAARGRRPRRRERRAARIARAFPVCVQEFITELVLDAQAAARAFEAVRGGGAWSAGAGVQEFITELLLYADAPGPRGRGGGPV
jgi:hypothetical protein